MHCKGFLSSWTSVFGLILYFLLSYANAQPGWYHFLVIILAVPSFFVAADDGELQVGRDGASYLCPQLCTYSWVLQHGTWVPCNASPLLCCKLGLVIHKCNCPQVSKDLNLARILTLTFWVPLQLWFSSTYYQHKEDSWLLSSTLM